MSIDFASEDSTSSKHRTTLWRYYRFSSRPPCKDTNHHEANHIVFCFSVLIKVMFALNYTLVSVQ